MGNLLEVNPLSSKVDKRVTSPNKLVENLSRDVFETRTKTRGIIKLILVHFDAYVSTVSRCFSILNQTGAVSTGNKNF